MKIRLRGRLTEKAIPGEVSRHVLDSIRTGSGVDQSILEAYEITEKDIRSLSKKFQSAAGKGKYSNCPRSYVFYLILKEKYPSIDWKIKGIGSSQKVNFKLPLIDCLQPSLLTLLLGRVDFESTSDFELRAGSIKKLCKADIDCLNKFLTKTDAIDLSLESMERLACWLRSVRNEGGTLFMLTCPDYSVEPSGDDAAPYRHNFKSVGHGIGQIAARILDVMPHVKTLIDCLGIEGQLTIVSAMADYEGFSDVIADRLQISKQEFMVRIQDSKSMFAKSAKELMPSIECVNFTSLCGGEQGWSNKTLEINRELEGDQGELDCAVDIVAEQRKSLYSRWYENIGEGADKYKKIAMAQSAEYAAIGYYLSKNFKNILVLGGDSELFEPFYRMYNKKLSAIYFKRRYC